MWNLIERFAGIISRCRCGRNAATRRRHLLAAVLHILVQVEQIVVVPVAVVHDKHLHEIVKVVGLLHKQIGHLQLANANQPESHRANGQRKVNVLFDFQWAELGGENIWTSGREFR